MKTSILAAVMALLAGSAAAQVNLDDGIPASCDSPMAHDIITSTINSYLEQADPALQVKSIVQVSKVYIEVSQFSCFAAVSLGNLPGETFTGTVEGMIGANGQLYTRFLITPGQPIP